MAQVYVDNTNAILLEGLRGEIDGAYINDAAVTVTVKDSDGVEVAGTSWPKAMSYIVASNGNYRAILADTLDFVAPNRYTAEITANGGSDRVGFWVFKFKAFQRNG